MADLSAFLKAAARVVPSRRQLEWFDTEMYAFVHFTVNTYTGREWGDGSEDPAIFNPCRLDCDAWVEAIKAAHLKGMVLTCKHHDGFCLWPSKYTEHSVKNSPYKNGKGDIVREAAEACARGGIKFGVYLSPWDRNSPLYGTPAYNDYYAAQLTELLTGYGELFMVWQDGACGEGPNGKKQVYDFDRFNALVRKYQPNACIFMDFGPDVRWCGNEAAQTRTAEWAVVPSDLCFRAEEQTRAPLVDSPLRGIYNTQPDIGALSNIIGAKGLAFVGSETDFSIRPGWFYHPQEEPRSAENLFDSYLRVCGGNSCMNLNIPPRPDGTFDPRDVEALRQFGKRLDAEFGRELPCACETVAESADGRCVIRVSLSAPARPRYVVLREDLTHGQRIESFEIKTGPGSAYRGSTVGHKKICQAEFAEDVNEIWITVTCARDKVYLRDITLY
ncbi:MAG: alpha-L-fucosidase [Clostridia bacterium]|nr:alpha-L-fucosidase [Clostridia bacterium]